MPHKRKKVSGKGINDMPIGFTKNKIYLLWKGMLRRCYSSVHQRTHPSYIGASVCEEWLTLSNFVAWVESQDMEGKELDKDILCPGNKRYTAKPAHIAESDADTTYRAYQSGTAGTR
jgi:hypothetical protein